MNTDQPPATTEAALPHDAQALVDLAHEHGWGETTTWSSRYLTIQIGRYVNAAARTGGAWLYTLRWVRHPGGVFEFSRAESLAQIPPRRRAGACSTLTMIRATIAGHPVPAAARPVYRWVIWTDDYREVVSGCSGQAYLNADAALRHLTIDDYDYEHTKATCVLERVDEPRYTALTGWDTLTGAQKQALRPTTDTKGRA